MTMYAQIDEDNFILRIVGEPDPEDMVGPPIPPPDEDGSFQWVAAMPPARVSRELVLKMVDGMAVWEDPRTLLQIQAAKVAEMSTICASRIVEGFKSSALGSEYHYPAKPTDQMNLAGSVLDSLIANSFDWTTPFWCADSNDVWEFRQHTASQIQQVGRDGKAAIVGAMTTNEGLRAAIMLAQTPSEVADIGWPP